MSTIQEAQQQALQQATGGVPQAALQQSLPPLPASVEKLPPAAVTTAAPVGSVTQQQQLMPAAVGVPAIPAQQQVGGIPVAQAVGVLPAPGAGGQQHTVTETVVVTTTAPGSVPTVVGHHNPVRATCPYCNNTSITVVDTKMGGLGWGLCIGLCVFAPPLCCIPCCVPACQDAVHICPRCGREIGKDPGGCC